MPEISRFYGIVIQMYDSDHPPPHLHAIYAGQMAVFLIATGVMSVGYLPPRAQRLVREWISEHRAELMNNWELLAVKQPPVKVPPLD